MTLHLIKLSVGVDDVDHLGRIQARRLAEAERAAKTAGSRPVLRHVTRNTPRRADEILEGGGSIFWVVRRLIQARQRIIDFEPDKREDGRPACAIVLEPLLVRTEPRRFRPFQGWRYFDAGDAPPDARESAAGEGAVPEAMARELRELGLL